ADTVRVMTCHASKGLEFSCVAVAGQTVPKVPGKYPWLPATLRPTANEDDEQADSLLFVGVTRAIRAVVVSWPSHAGQGAQARRKKVVPLLESWRQLGSTPLREWNATGADDVSASGSPVWGFPARGVLKAYALTASACPLLTYMETILSIRFPEEEVVLYPRFVAVVRRALRRIATNANETSRHVTAPEVDEILDDEWPSERYNEHPHFALYRSAALDIARGFATAFSPGPVGSVMMDPELATLGDGRGPKVILDLVAYFREPGGRVVGVAFRPESYAAKAKGNVLLWSKLEENKRISFVLLDTSAGNAVPKVYSGEDRTIYDYVLRSRNTKEVSAAKEGRQLTDKYLALARGDLATEVNPFNCDRCRGRVSCPHWVGAL
ncbi:MAG: 3'-5' exonuclease, partial [bacterium]